MRFMCACLHKWHVSGDLYLTTNGLTDACLNPAGVSREWADCGLPHLDREPETGDIPGHRLGASDAAKILDVHTPSLRS
jgi:hypothetical protein